jgi:hypothetical protein
LKKPTKDLSTAERVYEIAEIAPGQTAELIRPDYGFFAKLSIDRRLYFTRFKPLLTETLNYEAAKTVPWIGIGSIRGTKFWIAESSAKGKEKTFLFRQDYKASRGKEIFLSFENKQRKKLYSLLRLRITSQNTAIIRELHTYGQQLPFIHSFPKSIVSPQHKGLGKKLIKETEKITEKEFGINKIAVISAVGVRGYFRKLGYKLENTYMVKKI